MSQAKIAAQTNCRYFSGYKPCGKNEVCSEKCAHKELATPHILIIHLEALGAVLRATVILPAIKRKWPNAHITWVTSPLASKILEQNHLVDRILSNNHDGVLALKTLSFDFTFCIDKSLNASGLIASSRSSGERRGFGVSAEIIDGGAIIPLNQEAERLWELGLSNHEKFFINKKPETQLLTEALGLTWQRDEYVFNFSETEKIFREAEHLRLGINTKAIGFNTGCSNMLPHKKLSVDGWVSLIKKIASKEQRKQLVLLGGPEDTVRNGEIVERLKDLGARVIQTPTENGLRAGFIYVDLCDSVVTGDSLGMHMAIALKKFVVSWFGPSCLHEIDFYDRGEGVMTEAECSPCWRRECNKPIMCYDLVNFEKIVNILSRHFGQSKLVCSKDTASLGTAKLLGDPDITL
jgi:heptosyltransferase-2